MPVVQKTFALTGASGTTIWRAGQTVTEELAKTFPQFMEGCGEQGGRHNPNLAHKLGKKEIARMSESDLAQWLRQFHPAALPPGEADKATLVELVQELAETYGKK